MIADFVRNISRQIRFNRGFALISVLILAIGVAANTSIFAVADALLLRPLPYPDPQSLIRIDIQTPQGLGNDTLEGKAVTFLLEKRPRNHAAAVRPPSGVNVGGTSTPQYLHKMQVSHSYFATLGVLPIMGRDFTEEEDRPGAAPVVVLSHAVWKEMFGGSYSVIGQSVNISGHNQTIIGVMPESFRSYPQSDIWVPLQLNPSDPDYVGDNYTVIARADPQLTEQQRQQEMVLLTREYDRLGLLAAGLKQAQAGFHATSLQRAILGPYGTSVVLLEGAVGFLLLIVCASVSSLLLSRISARRRELAVRSALGATKGHLIALVLGESLGLSVVGGVLGVCLAMWGIPLVSRHLPVNLPRIHEIGANFTIALYGFCLAVLTAILFGVAPTVYSLRGQADVLKDTASNLVAARSGARAMRVLVVVQTALSLILLAGASVLFQTFLKIRTAPVGAQSERLYAFQVSLATERYQNANETNRLVDNVLNRLHQVPGVAAAAYASGTPLIKTLNWFVIPSGKADDKGVHAELRIVSPDYIATLQNPMISGRSFTISDSENASRVAIINRTLAQNFWPGSDAVGQYVKLGPRVLQVVGVMVDLRDQSLDSPTAPMLIIPLSQAPKGVLAYVNHLFSACFLVRTQGNAVTDSAVRQVLTESDPELPVSSVESFATLVDSSVQEPRFYTVLLVLFALFALLLTALGLYGLLNHQVTQRKKEISLRIALGARRADILKLIGGQALRLVTLGVVLGMIGATLLNKVLAGIIFGLHPVDPVAITAAVGLILMMMLGVALNPARRAADVDPATTLKLE